MRFSATALLALPILAAAAESPFEQYKAQFQNFLGSFGASPPKAEPQAAEQPASPPSTEAEFEPAENELQSLTLDNWKDTLYSPVKPDATQPEEWWVFITGRNKTCFGHCLKVEAAFNETAKKFATMPNAPHAALLNCENEPVLCNSWSAITGTLWVFEMLPPPAPIDVYLKRFNLSSTTSQTFLDVHAKDNKDDFYHHDGYFHPFDGVLAQNHLAVPIGYIFWLFNAVPSWAMMLGVSFLSRTMMNRRMNNNVNRPRNAAPAAAPRAAPPGDARS